MGDTVAQPILFSDFPEQPKLVDRVKRFIHSGKIACRKDDLVERVANAVLSNVSKRRIAASFHIGRETIDAIMLELERAGKLRPLQERLAAGWAEIALLSQENLIELLLDKRVLPNVLFLTGATATDKWSLLTGSATQRIEVKREEVGEREVAEEFARMKRAIVAECGPAGLPVPAAVESESPASVPIPAIIQPIPVPDTALGTASQPVSEGGGDRRMRGGRKYRWIQPHTILTPKARHDHGPGSYRT